MVFVSWNVRGRAFQAVHAEVTSLSGMVTPLRVLRPVGEVGVAEDDVETDVVGALERTCDQEGRTEPEAEGGAGEERGCRRVVAWNRASSASMSGFAGRSAAVSRLRSGDPEAVESKSQAAFRVPALSAPTGVTTMASAVPGCRLPRWRDARGPGGCTHPRPDDFHTGAGS